jgi:hypothetical protein
MSFLQQIRSKIGHYFLKKGLDSLQRNKKLVNINSASSIGILFELTDETVYYKAIWSIAENNLLLKGFDNEHFGTDKKYKHYNSTKQ